MFLNAFKQTFHISIWKSERRFNVKSSTLFSYEDANIGRFSYLHYCTFKSSLNSQENQWQSRLFSKIEGVCPQTYRVYSVNCSKFFSCCVFQYIFCVAGVVFITFRKVRTHVLCRFKSCPWLVEDLRWWES